MSTFKEKAKELAEKYDTTLTYLESKSKAKECALIAVDEIIEMLSFDLGHDDTARGLCEYWQEVKSEIEKL